MPVNDAKQALAQKEASTLRDHTRSADKIVQTLSSVCARLAAGDYAEAKKLFQLTIPEKSDEVIAGLAESFGLMLVKLEAREYELNKMVNDLDAAYKRLSRGQNTLSRENKKLRADLQSIRGPGQIVGKSPAIQNLIQQAERAAKVNATVLVTGETGTGKGMLAKHIHYHGPRAKGPFVSINCAAIPATLLESELFGIEKGVASGVDARIGRFEQASGGTLFLDEIGDMPLESQAKILHVIESGTVERIGGRKTIPVDVRIIAATHKDLVQACTDKEFRSDLYYRLNVIRLHIPALRERVEDICQLATFFLNNTVRRNMTMGRYIEKEALDILRRYSWPGNVRELENEIERAALLAVTEGIQPADLSAALLPPEQSAILSSLFLSTPSLPLPGSGPRRKWPRSARPQKLSDSMMEVLYGGPVLPEFSVPPPLARSAEYTGAGMYPPAAAAQLSPRNIAAELYSGYDRAEEAQPAPARIEEAPAASVPTLDSAEITLIKQALAQSGGNKSQTARLLGISREGLRKKLKRLNISAD